MGRVSWRRLGQTLYEMAFLVVRDNAVLNQLSAAALAASFVQMYAFAFSPTVPWGQPRLQAALAYTLLRMPPGVGEVVGYWAMACAVTCMLLLAAISGREMATKGAVSSMWALKGEWPPPGEQEGGGGGRVQVSRSR
jgi:hypothetical protein